MLKLNCETYMDVAMVKRCSLGKRFIFPKQKSYILESYHSLVYDNESYKINVLHLCISQNYVITHIIFLPLSYVL